MRWLATNSSPWSATCASRPAGLEQARVFCLRASDELRGLTPCALNEAAEALLKLWTGAAVNGTDPAAAVTQAIAKTVSAATQVYTHLQEFARVLAAALQRTAQALGSNDAPPEEELLHAVHEMPRFDLPPVSGNFHRPWIRYPRALARKRIHSQASAGPRRAALAGIHHTRAAGRELGPRGLGGTPVEIRRFGGCLPGADGRLMSRGPVAQRSIRRFSTIWPASTRLAEHEPGPESRRFPAISLFIRD
jgi:hypothetical protein